MPYIMSWELLHDWYTVESPFENRSHLPLGEPHYKGKIVVHWHPCKTSLDINERGSQEKQRAAGIHTPYPWTFILYILLYPTSGYKDSLILIPFHSAFPRQVAGGSPISVLTFDTIREAVPLNKKAENLVLVFSYYNLTLSWAENGRILLEKNLLNDVCLFWFWTFQSLSYKKNFIDLRLGKEKWSTLQPKMVL